MVSAASSVEQNVGFVAVISCPSIQIPTVSGLADRSDHLIGQQRPGRLRTKQVRQRSRRLRLHSRSAHQRHGRPRGGVRRS